MEPQFFLSPNRLANPLWRRLQVKRAAAHRVGRHHTTKICLLLFGMFSLPPFLLWQGGIQGNLARDLGFSCGVIAFGLGFLAYWKPRWAAYIAPCYAFLLGMFASGLAFALEWRFPGVALQSLCLTLTIFVLLLLLYGLGWLRPNAGLQVAVMTAVSAIALVYLTSWLIGFFSGEWLLGRMTGWGATLWFAFLALIASLNLLLDFRRLQTVVERGADAATLWLAVMAMITTLVWLYVSLLRALASRRS